MLERYRQEQAVRQRALANSGAHRQSLDQPTPAGEVAQIVASHLILPLPASQV